MLSGLHSSSPLCWHSTPAQMPPHGFTRAEGQHCDAEELSTRRNANANVVLQCGGHHSWLHHIHVWMFVTRCCAGITKNTLGRCNCKRHSKISELLCIIISCKEQHERAMNDSLRRWVQDMEGHRRGRDTEYSGRKETTTSKVTGND